MARGASKTLITRRNRRTVAVVIPYYNGSKYIDRSARSVLSQTVKPDEFVVVNDGSRPEEAAYLHKAAETYGFRVIDQENGGQGAARNAGVRATQSELICLLDQDDFFLDRHIEILKDALPLKDPHFGWVYGDLFEAEGNGDVIRTSMVTEHARHPKTSAFDLIRYDMFVLPSASLISRKAFEAVGGFDSQFTGYEDDDLFMRMFRAGFTNYFVRDPVTVWCINPESTSYSIRMIRSRMRYFKKLVADYPDDPSKARFYLRDLMIPRFYGAFAGDIQNAILRPIPERDDRLRPYLDELLTIFGEFSRVITSNRYVPLKFKMRLAAQRAVFATKSKLVLHSARLGADYWRRFWHKVRQI